MKRRLFEMLNNYAVSEPSRYHMPGHKGKGDGILSSVYPYDITELSFSDNLAEPCGVIDLAEKDIAALTGAKKVRILTGGSSLGVLTTVYAAAKFFNGQRNKIVLPESSHKSVYNAIKILGLEPVFINEKIVDGLPWFDVEDIAELCDNGAIGLFLTSPDYFGRCVDLEYAKKITQKNGCFLMVDGAHGAHMAFTDKNRYAGTYADIWVESAHKTLKTLTQGALLGINDLRLSSFAEDGLSIFSTSSPSYLIMSSVEDGYKSFAEIPESVFENCKKAKSVFAERLCKDYSVINSDDFLKLCIDLKGKTDGATAGKLLEENGIFAELACGRFLIFMISPYFNEEQAIKLVTALNNLPVNGENDCECFSVFAPERKMSYTAAADSCAEWVDLKAANGRISAGEVGLFPPCFPLVTAGEMFNNELIARLLTGNTFGIKDGKVKVVVNAANEY